MQGSGRWLGDRRIRRIPEAAGRQRPFREIVNRDRVEVVEDAGDELFGIIDDGRAQDESWRSSAAVIRRCL
jgi:hypothetical protein